VGVTTTVVLMPPVSSMPVPTFPTNNARVYVLRTSIHLWAEAFRHKALSKYFRMMAHITRGLLGGRRFEASEAVDSWTPAFDGSGRTFW